MTSPLHSFETRISSGLASESVHTESIVDPLDFDKIDTELTHARRVMSKSLLSEVYE